jgi:hypothetical protein
VDVGHNGEREVDRCLKGVSGSHMEKGDAISYLDIFHA